MPEGIMSYQPITKLKPMTTSNAINHIVCKCRKEKIHPTDLITYTRKLLRTEWKEVDANAVAIIMAAQRELQFSAYL
jgi:hypothetical protein